MKALIQRVSHASVVVEHEEISKIDAGILLFLGIGKNDDENDIRYIVDKVINLRIFEGEDNKMDLSISDIKGELLVVSQFTLYGSCNKGRRPDFTNAASAENAKHLYDKTLEAFKNAGIIAQEGKFQTYMNVKIENDGPVTIMIESPTKN